MELGGLRTDRPRAFLLSSTNGAETTGLAVFRAVVRAYTDTDTDPVAVMERRGRLLAEGVNAAAAETGIGDHLSVLGRPSCQIFRTTDATGAPSVRVNFVSSVDGAVTVDGRSGGLGSAADKAVFGLLRELAHRVNNTFAVILAITQQSLRTAPPQQAFAERSIGGSQP